MGREVRMVPPDWQHPRDEEDEFVPLHDGYRRAVEEREQWRKGFVRDYATGGFKPKESNDEKYTEDDYFGEGGVDPADYMPEWPPEVATHFRMYENTSEGTPISPPFATAEELARWLADTGASAFGGVGASYDGWLATIRSKHGAPTAIMKVGPEGTTVTSGVDAMAAPRQTEDKDPT